MSTSNYTKDLIRVLSIIQVSFENKLSLRECARNSGVCKNKVSFYYKYFLYGFSINEILVKHENNLKKRGRKRIELPIETISYINTKLKDGWSLDVIAQRNKTSSKSTLYLRGNELNINMKQTHKYRKKKKKKDPNKLMGKVKDMKSIHERDKTFPGVKNNTVFGHFEGDTIIGSNHSSVLITLAERATKCMIILTSINGKYAYYIKNRIVSYFNNIPYKDLITITFDQGKEFAYHKEMEKEVNKEFIVYFSDAGCPGQRGLCENNNSLIRRYLPKSSNLNKYSQNYLNQLAEKYNNIPRKSLNYKTPNEVLYELTGLKSIIYDYKCNKI